MFTKLVVTEPVGLLPYGIERLRVIAGEVILYEDVPQSVEEIRLRIEGADAILTGHRGKYTEQALSGNPDLRYIGMCCSLYSEESANVDIPYARANGIEVTGIRDYGDNGVVEYVLYEAIGLLHGYGPLRWDDYPHELTDKKAGMVGMGTTGSMIADALQLLGAEISYFARSVKPDKEAKGMHFRPLHDLLRDSDIICLGLNKNTILLGEAEFAVMTGKKMLFNTSIGPGHDTEALKKWLAADPEHYFFCDSLEAAGDPDILNYPNAVRKGPPGSGASTKANERLTDKVLANIEEYMRNTVCRSV